ncbi:phospholipase D-like domain-containing protein [Telmatobacter sp. DSM 110680]|uniref:Phospholipase D-like domain-containing protein n=1 Tax=Telmatobacter sp. DSM 110680 TaxID=3036704 RepID=A0AAU7DR52_9BACT
MMLAVSVPTGVAVLALIALIFFLSSLLGGLIGPLPRYKLTSVDELPPNDCDRFLEIVEALTDAQLNRTGDLEVLTNGPAFYPAELEAIRSSAQSVNLEAYIFQKSDISRQYVDALTERARTGVRVNLVLDAFGSAGTGKSFFKTLLDAGGKVNWYNSPRWDRLMHMDNRTHRELMIVDGRIGFIGGAGIADQWYKGADGQPRWRDSVVRVEGEAVYNLQSTFAENWLAASGELLTGEAYFPRIQNDHPLVSMVVNSTPTVGGSTRARILFQLLLASARRSISITTPYFLPDKSLMQELCNAVERGLRVRILVPGRKSDHMVTRSTSRAGYGELLKAGAEVYEYRPSMIHAKVLCVDDLWLVVATNFDNRSFGINDEVNLAVRDTSVAMRFENDMALDLKQSRRISLEDWNHRPLTERATELMGMVIERQQ